MSDKLTQDLRKAIILKSLDIENSFEIPDTPLTRDFFSSIQETIQHLLTCENFQKLSSINPDKEIAIIWGIDDVLSVRPDLNESEAGIVLERVKKNHDANDGLSWDIVASTAEYLFPEGA